MDIEALLGKEAYFIFCLILFLVVLLILRKLGLFRLIKRLIGAMNDEL